jgi:Fuc2NAc and GlcNAc transferase
MSAVGLALLGAAVLPVAAGLAWLALHFATRRNMLDVPCDRSLHTAPTPRGGGIAIALCTLAGAGVLTATGMLVAGVGWAIVSGGAVVALLGWLDDRGGLPVALRGAGYLGAAALGAWLAGGLPRIAAGEFVLTPGAAGLLLAVPGIAWLINLYNFMDGADGIAAVQGIGAAAFAAVLFVAAGDGGAAALCVIVAASCAGFLVFNVPPARLFMGDVGSCLLGYVFGVLALHGERGGAVPLLAWLLLLLPFVMDATLTLARRMLRGEKWYSPHRTHAYQLLVQSGLGHRGLLLRFLILEGLVLGPATLVAESRGWLHVAVPAAAALAVACWCGVQWRHGMLTRREA